MKTLAMLACAATLLLASAGGALATNPGKGDHDSGAANQDGYNDRQWPYIDCDDDDDDCGNQRRRRHHNNGWNDDWHEPGWNNGGYWNPWSNWGNGHNYTKHRRLPQHVIVYKLERRKYRHISRIKFKHNVYIVRCVDRRGRWVLLTIDPYSGEILDRDYL